MKKETWTCDVCGNPADEKKMVKAVLTVGMADSYIFDVCATCWTESPKGVFKQAFNSFCRIMGYKK